MESKNFVEDLSRRNNEPEWLLNKRLAAYELFYASDPQPHKVVLNEWIEVAKRYGAEHSSAFVNGILDSML